MAGTTTTGGTSPAAAPAPAAPHAIEAVTTGGGTESTRLDTDKRKNNARGLLHIPAARKR
jgi:hypothetical protein